MAFDYKNQQAYHRKAFVPFSEATLSIASSPVLYGLAVYTVFALNWNETEQAGYFFRLKDHYERLGNAAKIMDFTPINEVLSFDDFLKIGHELITRNAIHEDTLVRAALFIDEEIAGTKIHGLTTSFSAYIYPLGEILPRSGTHLMVSSWTRTPDNSIPSRAKINGSYVNASLMKNEALLNGYDDAIALDEHGHVAESTVANLFMIRQGRLITPDSGTDILEGITRDTIIRLADKLNLTCDQRSIDRSELYIADEIFLCGSSARVTPVLSVDHRPVGNGQPGEITQKVSELYDRISRNQDQSFKNWLTKLHEP